MRWLTLTVVLLVTACADTHEFVKENSSMDFQLTGADSIYVSVPENGMYGTNTYNGSGQTTAQIIYSAFSKHTRSVKVGRGTQNFDQALEAARKNGQKYLVFTTILHWEDRVTEWSSIPDKVELRIEVIESASGNTISSGVVKGKSGLATFGGDHPQDLLPKPIEKFVSSLY